MTKAFDSEAEAGEAAVAETARGAASAVAVAEASMEISIAAGKVAAKAAAA